MENQNQESEIKQKKPRGRPKLVNNDENKNVTKNQKMRTTINSNVRYWTRRQRELEEDDKNSVIN